MDEILAFVALAGTVAVGIPLIVWARVSARLRRVEGELESTVKAREADRELVASLLRRMFILEKARTEVAATLPQAKVAREADVAPRVTTPVAPPMIAPSIVAVEEGTRIPKVAIQPPQQPLVVPPRNADEPAVPVFVAEGVRPVEPLQESTAQAPFPEPIPTASWSDRLRANMGGKEWEAVVGGNWLNKLGVLVLVIGVALFLGYEFTRVGPAGRVGIGFAVSLTMLLGGVAWEREQGYAIFARGLMGGGWAALYFTTYAMYGVDAAKVISSPYLATALLLAVATGMVLHSLRYKSQAATGLAYFIAFATLGLSESTPFSVLALLPLAGSLLYLSNKFDWHKMAVFGLFATYATVASRPDTGASLSTTQALFGAYWLLFETFDLLRLKKRAAGLQFESLIFPLNALGFLGLSLVKWQRTTPEHLYVALAAGAGLYLVSALLRTKFRPPSSCETDADTGVRMASGGYEGPITLASILAAASIVRGATGQWINAGLMIEGEILFLTGVRFGEIYLRQLAGAAFLGLLSNMLSINRQDDSIALAGRKWMHWTPMAVLAAAVFYANRLLRTVEGAVYSSVAAGLLTIVLGVETTSQYVTLAWTLFAVALFELGFLKKKIEFRFQSYVIGVLGIAAGLFMNTFGDDATWHLSWLPLGVCAALFYTIAMQVQSADLEQLSDVERKRVSWVASAAAAGFLTVNLWKIVPDAYLGAAWMILGAVLFELGLRKLPPQFRKLSYFVAAIGAGNVFLNHVLAVEKGAKPSEAISLLIASLVSYGLSARVFRAASESSEPGQATERERSLCRDAFAAAGTLFALTLSWLELPAPVVAVAWAAIGMILLETGFTFSTGSFRALGNIVAASAFGRLFLANFTDLGDTLHISHRILTVVPIIASQYYAWWRYRGAEAGTLERRWSRLYLYAPAILAVALARFELGRTLAVVGWALFGFALYRAGLVRKIIDLRWQSYAISALVFWRCWNTNFYVPESLWGIRGRILTGAIVVICLYGAQLLSPHSEGSDNGKPAFLDRYARTYYSVLASVLLAVLLYYEVSGGMLTMALGIEALALLGAGFPLRDRFQRLSGLFLFLVCVLKLFLYDLRQLETVNRIISFIVLGASLVTVSWIYTRFRDRIQRYL